MSEQVFSLKKHFKDLDSSNLLFPFYLFSFRIAWGFIIIIGISENGVRCFPLLLHVSRGDERAFVYFSLLYLGGNHAVLDFLLFIFAFIV